MKTLHKPYRLAIVAAVVAALGISVYAVSTMNLFSFVSGDKYVTMRTTESMTEDEAKVFVGDKQSESIPEDVPVMRAEQEEFTFETVEEAGQQLDMTLLLPAALPEMKLDSATGQIVHFGDNMENRYCWLIYSDAQERIFGLTVVREIVAEGVPVTGYTTHDMDDGSLGSYKSKSGAEYTTLTESNDTGDMTAHIATTAIGEYEYSLVFVGFNEAEQHAIIDSADLSIYQ